MNILYILNSNAQFSGASKSLKILLQGLIAREVKPYIVMPEDGPLRNELEDMGCEVLITNYRANAYPHFDNLKNRILFIPRLIARLVTIHLAIFKVDRWIKNKNINIVHSNVSVVNVGYHVAKRNSLPHIFHIREYGDKDFNIHLFPTRKIALKKVADSYTICITKDLQRYYGLESDPKSMVVYNGINDISKPLIQSTSRDYYLFAGRIEPTKGLLELVQAYKLYHDSITNSLPLLVAGNIGSQEYFDTIQQYITTNKLTNEIKMLGLRSDIESLMANAAAIIIPSHFEGFGRCMAEAMWNKCLVIGNDTGGTHEQFTNGNEYCGREIGLRYSNIPGLAKHLIEVHQNGNDYYEQMRKDAYSAVTHLYSNESYINSVYNLYKTII